MILDHRTYIVAHGRVQEYLELYERVALPIQMRHLGHLVGFFTTDIGTQNQVVHIWAYDSIADRQIRRDKMEADPEWQAYVASVRGLFGAQENKILKPTRFSPLGGMPAHIFGQKD